MAHKLRLVDIKTLYSLNEKTFYIKIDSYYKNKNINYFNITNVIVNTLYEIKISDICEIRENETKSDYCIFSDSLKFNENMNYEEISNDCIFSINIDKETNKEIYDKNDRFLLFDKEFLQAIFNGLINNLDSDKFIIEDLT